MSRFNTQFTLLMSYASILNQANVSAAAKLAGDPQPRPYQASQL
jgi:hypothetical protein